MLWHYWLSRWLIPAHSWGTWGSSDGWLAGVMGDLQWTAQWPYQNFLSVALQSDVLFAPSPLSSPPFTRVWKLCCLLFAHLDLPQEFPSINLMFALSHRDVGCLVVMWWAQSCSVTCLNIVRLDVLTCYLDFPVYFHTGAQSIIFFSTCCLCLVLIPRWYCPWRLVEFIWKTIWACWVSERERESIGRI